MAAGGQSGVPGNHVDELENAFQSLFSALVGQDHVNIVDQDEIKTGVEQATQKFLDVSKEIESFFLQKRLLLSVHRPEQIIKEDVDDLRTELVRKEALVQKLQSKVQLWQENLSNLQTGQQQTPTLGRLKQEPSIGSAATVTSLGQPRHLQPQQQPPPPSLPPLQLHPMVGAPPVGTPTGHPSGQYMGPLAHLEQAASQFGMR